MNVTPAEDAFESLSYPVLFLGRDWLSVASNFISLTTCNEAALRTKQFDALKILDSDSRILTVASVARRPAGMSLSSLLWFVFNPKIRVTFRSNGPPQPIETAEIKDEVIARIDRSPELWSGSDEPGLDQFKAAIARASSAPEIIRLIQRYPDPSSIEV